MFIFHGMSRIKAGRGGRGLKNVMFPQSDMPFKRYAR